MSASLEKVKKLSGCNIVMMLQCRDPVKIGIIGAVEVVSDNREDW